MLGPLKSPTKTTEAYGEGGEGDCFRVVDLGLKVWLCSCLRQQNKNNLLLVNIKLELLELVNFLYILSYHIDMISVVFLKSRHIYF